jgi:DivIVA domain-containing protein
MDKTDKPLEALSSKLTPTEIKNKEFRKTVLGYSPHEVVEFLDATAKTWERVQKQEKVLLSNIEKLKEKIKMWEDRESELNRLRESALQDAEGIRKEALKEAEKMFLQVEERAQAVKARTEEWLTKVIAEVEETEKQRADFVNTFKTALDGHYELLDLKKQKEESLGTKLNRFLKGADSEIGVQ